MKNISRFALAMTAIVLCAPLASARADTVPGWYMGAGALATFPTDANSDVAGTNNKIEYDTGWGVLGSVGYAWGNGWMRGLRTKGELSFSRATTDKVNGVNAASGRINNLDVMGNLLYDIQTGTRFTPYFGGGIGFASVDVDHIGTLTNTGSLNDSSVEFAYQAIGGVAYEIADHWSVTADYRYIATTDPEFKTTAGGTARTENASHNVVFGVRYTMHAPEKPMPPLAEAKAPIMAQPQKAAPPAVAPVPQSYMVFFDFDKSDLTPEAQRILASAAQDFKKGGYIRIVVTGHTDTVGTPEYNQKLSERRAASVKAELIKLGVEPGMMEAVGVGEKGLLVPTEKDVREAQNRRAEIVFDKK